MAARVMSVEDATARVLVADDQPDVREALRLLLRQVGFHPECATSVQDVREQLMSNGFDLLLMDLNYARDTTSGREGLALIAEIRARHPLLPIIALTGWGSIDLAVEAMRRGACGFVEKPWDNTALIHAIVHEVTEGRAARRADARAVRELDDARLIQRALLPAALPTIDNGEVAVLWRPAGAVGGDCYDVVRSGSRLDLWIADVAGKGLPAALLMAHFMASVRICAAEPAAPCHLVARVNRVLCANAALAPFITACHAVVDLDARTMAITNAGHPQPILLRSDGTIERLTAGGPVLGVLEDARYEQEQVALRAGDRVLFFTDGLTEAKGPDNVEFGDDRLVALVESACHVPAQQLLDRVLDGVAAFSGGLDDDATLLALALR